MALMVRERRQQQALTLLLPLPPQSPPSFLPFPFHFPQQQLIPSPPGSPVLSDIDKLSIIGRGGSGTVYKVIHRPTSSVLALKVLPLTPDAAREADIIRCLDSPYVVRCHAVLTDADHLCFVMEYMARGSLRSLLQERKRLPEATIAVVARRVLEGLNYLHCMGIVHGDINPSNLLVNEKGEIKIADFGTSRAGTEEEWGGTCAYMSPERFDGEGFDRGGDGGGFAGDVWGLGVVLLECYVGRFPLVEEGERPDWATLMCMVCFGRPQELPESASPEFRGFVGRCLEKEWRSRGTVEELLAHPFLTKYCCSNSCLMESLNDTDGY